MAILRAGPAGCTRQPTGRRCSTRRSARSPDAPRVSRRLTSSWSGSRASRACSSRSAVHSVPSRCAPSSRARGSSWMPSRPRRRRSSRRWPAAAACGRAPRRRSACSSCRCARTAMSSGRSSWSRRRSGFDERQRELRPGGRGRGRARRGAAFSLSRAGRARTDALELAGDALAAAADETHGGRAGRRAGGRGDRRALRAPLALRRGRGGARGDRRPGGSGHRRPPRRRRARGSARPRSGHGGNDLGRRRRDPAARRAAGRRAPARSPAAPSPSGPDAPRLATFAVRAAHMLRVAERRRDLVVELERTARCSAIVGQAIAQLSLAHTLETAVEQICELLSSIGSPSTCSTTEASRRRPGAACPGRTRALAEHMLELALGPGRARGLVFVPDAATSPGRRARRGRGAGVESVLGVPLRSGEESSACSPPIPRAADARARTRSRSSWRSRRSSRSRCRTRACTSATSAEKEEAKRERDRAKDVAKRLQALYEISRSFARASRSRRRSMRSSSRW